MRLNTAVLPSDTEDWTWQTIAHGAKSIMFFAYYSMNQGYEANGYGLVGLDGIPTERYSYLHPSNVYSLVYLSSYSHKWIHLLKISVFL